MASSLKSKFVIPAFLAAVLTGCDGKDAQDMQGMIEAIKTACPTENSDTASHSQCAEAGRVIAQKLGNQFQKSCTFNSVPKEAPKFAVPLIIGGDVDKCLKTVEEVAGDAGAQQVGEIRHAMAAGLTYFK